MSLFSNFNLDGRILKTLEEIGFSTPTPIQALAIPKILEGLDLIACAQTGTGKTAAFILPTLHHLATQAPKNGPHVLILVPTRELANQVAQEAKKFSKHLPQIKTVCIFGGVPYPVQKKMLASRYDILVATPGRLLDHLNAGRIQLSNVKLFALDEADRMLDMGFIDDVLKISNAIPQPRQTLLFSATIDQKILPISRKLQKSPCEVRAEVEAFSKANIEQRLYYVDNIFHKKQLLEHLLKAQEIKQTIVFTATKSQAEELSEFLDEKGFLSSPLHGDMNQRQRTRTIDKMKGGNIDVLVATDVAARGIDISNLSHVINFDLPHNPEDFVHRVGRTGRAGASGIAISFATYKEVRSVSRINEMMGSPLEQMTVEGLEPKSKTEGRSSRSPSNKPRFFSNKRPQGGKSFGARGGFSKTNR